jgi:hypothetical protein
VVSDRKPWVLDPETKGSAPLVVQQQEKRAKEPEPRGPRRFKVVDVMTRKVLAEGADARTTVDLLRDVRSIVDVAIYVWEEKAGKWQQLTQREARMLWDLRGS